MPPGPSRETSPPTPDPGPSLSLTPRPRPLSFTQPLHLLPSGNVMRDNTINHSLRAARWGGSGKEPKGTDCSLEKPNGRNSPPPARGLSKFQRGSLRALRDLKCTMIIIGGGSNALRRALAKAEKAREKKRERLFQMGPIEAEDSGVG